MTVETVFTDFLVKVRDAAAEALEQLAPTEIKEATYNPENIKWNRATGQKGIFECYPAYGQKAKPTADYVNLLSDLKNHEGKLQRSGLFYWLFDNETIGRKPAKR